MNALRHLVLLVAVALAGPLGAQTFAPLVGGHLPFSEGGAVPPQLEDLLAADLDGDGALDLVALGMRDNFVCRNDRAGGLVAWQRLGTLGYDLRRGALVDVDGDGDLDVLAGPGTTRPNATAQGPVRQYENRAATFVDVTPQRMPTGSWLCGALVAFDHDRDGDLDLAMSVFLGTTIDLVVMDNDGRGNFAVTTATRLPAGLPRLEATFLAATDLDRDGDLDLVASSRAVSLFLRNDGSGRFANHSTSLPPAGAIYAVYDFDQDGDDDLLGVNAVWLNNGSASAFTARNTGVALDQHNVRVADLDGDGRLDLLTTQFQLFWGIARNDGLPHVRLGRADGTFVEQLAFMPAELRAEQALMTGNTHWVGSSPMLVIDLDGDGRQDVLHGGWKADVSGNSWTIGLPPRAFLNRDGVEFRDGSRRTIGMLDKETYGLVAGDVDGDGDADLILGQYPDRELRNRGDGTFELGQTLPGSGGSRSGVLADLDGDGDLDFVRSGFHADYWPGAPPSLLLRQGSAWVTAPLPPIVDPAVSFAPGDVDGDGDVDLVVGCIRGSPNGARNQLLLNDGTARFTDAGPARLPQQLQDTRLALLRDFDRDGDLDLVELARNYPANRLRLSLNDGTGVFTDVGSTLPAMPAPYSLAAVDVDRDGDVDLITSGTTLINDGTGRFAAQSNSFPDFEHLVDMDGSGAWTIVQTVRYGVQIGGQFFGWNSDSLDVTLPVDLDRDGDLDVVVAGWLGNQRYNFNTVAGVLFNLRRQLFAPRLLRVGQPWVLSLQATTAGSLAIPVLGTALLAPRLPLPPFGSFGIDPTTAIVLPATTAGTSPVANELSLPVPADASLVGVPLHAQALIVPSSGLQDGRLTGVVSDRITR